VEMDCSRRQTFLTDERDDLDERFWWIESLDRNSLRVWYGYWVNPSVKVSSGSQPSFKSLNSLNRLGLILTTEALHCRRWDLDLFSPLLFISSPSR
jgi:hypothetical protein